MPNNTFKIKRVLEDGMEKSHYGAAVLMDLSKAVDCLPHDILLC